MSLVFQVVPRAGAGAAIVGVPVGAWLVLPLLGVLAGSAEAILILAVVFTALYGSDRHSDRAFRLLRWSLNRPEPLPAAAQGKSGSGKPGRRDRRGRT